MNSFIEILLFFNSRIFSVEFYRRVGVLEIVKVIYVEGGVCLFF